ncbi:PREDICTED: SUMO-activating enzyme subunit 1-like [Amphimedon queenslandica]|uniref:SUMO-activating enzyme subunit 1 n=1 Tax=Amphimedon queenslandica TaxID=400682 RepID=A0A1X7USX3_AMPQE|nr:PREDICTED: SUMO-activating enzyme subunit 1-like [Amphimedon queenslandica]|eukprot:XP_003386877.1 PREDICTED: SUMO-activating enzyme subunit 1-like [Amphimedon queenslandica]
MADDRLRPDEAEQYDRQIRLWGLEAQKRLRASRVLLIGLGGLGAEVCKDIVLAGIKSLTIIDNEYKSDVNIGNRFLYFTKDTTRAKAVMSRLRVLNPNVVINTYPDSDTTSTDNTDTNIVKAINDEYISKFDLLCATGCSQDELLHLNEICHRLKVKFFCGDTWGYYGYFFTDLQEHSYVITVPKEKEVAMEIDESSNKDKHQEVSHLEEEEEEMTIKKVMSFSSLQEALSHDWSKKPSRYFKRIPPTYFIIQVLQQFRDHKGRNPSIGEDAEEDRQFLYKLCEDVTKQQNISPDLINKEFVNYCFSELSPVCAIVGGVLAQEIIKAISANDIPFNNIFMYDGVNSTGIVEALIRN